jgi:hypothetical protein
MQGDAGSVLRPARAGLRLTLTLTLTPYPHPNPNQAFGQFGAGRAIDLDSLCALGDGANPKPNLTLTWP